MIWQVIQTRVQDAFLCLLGQDKGQLGGYKIAYTSDEKRRLRGISSPYAGGMFASTIQDSPATFRSADYVGLAIECEVAVCLEANYIEFLAVAFEMLDFRGGAAGTELDATAIAGSDIQVMFSGNGGFATH